MLKPNRRSTQTLSETLPSAVVCPKIESFPSSYHCEGVFCLCVWMQWFHRVRPKGRCGHGLLHITLFHTTEQSILQQHQPATWNLCPWITWPRQVSRTLDGTLQRHHTEEINTVFTISEKKGYYTWLKITSSSPILIPGIMYSVGVQWIGFRQTMGVSWSSVQMPVARTHQQEEYWRLQSEKIMVSYSVFP